MTTNKVIAAALEAEAYATSQTNDIVDWKAIAQERFYAIAYRQGLEDAANLVQANAQLCATGGYGHSLLSSNAAAIRTLKDTP